MGVKVRERPSGSGVWWIFINHQGKRKAKKIGRNKKAAEEAAAKIEAKLVLNEMGIDHGADKKAPLFKDYADIWLEGYVKQLRRPTTYTRYKGVLEKYIKPTIGDKPIDKITRGDIRNMLLKCFNRGLSRSSICIIRDATSGVMGYALDEELILANPVTGITSRLGLERKKRLSVEPFTFEEAEHFLETCRKFEPGYYAFFLTAFRTGMRLGELLGLRWGDIDWRGKFIRVERSFKNNLMSETKTGKVRRVDMSDQLIEVLRSLYTKRKEEGLGTGQGLVETIFHRNGEPMAQNSIRNVFKRLLRKAEMRDMRLHDIRHTFASLLLSNGQSPVYVREQMGHSSIQITVDVYGHLIPSSNREAVNQLDSPATIRNLSATTEKEKAVTH